MKTSARRVTDVGHKQDSLGMKVHLPLHRDQLVPRAIDLAVTLAIEGHFSVGQSPASFAERPLIRPLIRKDPT